MKTLWVKSALLGAVVLLVFGVAMAAEKAAVKKPTPKKPTLVVNLTSGEADLHAAAMGLHFAEHGLADGREVVVFFNVRSAPLARKDLPETVKFKDMPPIKQMITKLLQDGAKMVVCPMCADVMSVKTEELAPGIEMIKDRKQIFDHLHVNTVVFTY